MSHRYLDTGPTDISDDDILKAMKDISGYLDITPGDFKEIYRFSYRHALDWMTHSVTAGEVMTTDVVFIKKDDTLETAAEIMARNGIAGVPVVENGEEVVGVISEKDFLFHMGGGRCQVIYGGGGSMLEREGMCCHTHAPAESRRYHDLACNHGTGKHTCFGNRNYLYSKGN